jgi:hypothetical protein
MAPVDLIKQVNFILLLRNMPSKTTQGAGECAAQGSNDPAQIFLRRCRTFSEHRKSEFIKYCYGRKVPSGKSICIAWNLSNLTDAS